MYEIFEGGPKKTPHKNKECPLHGQKVARTSPHGENVPPPHKRKNIESPNLSENVPQNAPNCTIHKRSRSINLL